MIEIVLCLAVGAVLGASFVRSAGAALDNEALLRENYRGVRIPTGVGLVIPVVLTGVAAVVVFLQVGFDVTSDGLAAVTRLLVPTLVASTAFCLLGLVDDVVGAGQSGGFAGHVRSLAQGRLTSGMVKLLGGAALSVVVVVLVDGPDATWWTILRDGATVALAANLGNLFDRAPGRTLKATSVWFLVMAVSSRDAALGAPAVGIGAGIGLLLGDLKERFMIGDAGSNVMGALCGLTLVVSTDLRSGYRWSFVVVLLLLNAASEFVSYSKVIDSVPPLRWLDRLGSLRPV